MKRALVMIACLAGLLITACRKQSDSSLKAAVITGFDNRYCACCGGLFINFNDDTALYSEDSYLISNDPAEFGISRSSTFPIYVNVKYVTDTFVNCGHIKILELTRRSK